MSMMNCKFCSKAIDTDVVDDCATNDEDNTIMCHECFEEGEKEDIIREYLEKELKHPTIEVIRIYLENQLKKLEVKNGRTKSTGQ